MLALTTEREMRQKLSSLIAVKKIIFAFNFIIWAAGCTAACIGIWFRVNRNFVTLIQRIEMADIEMKSTSIYLGANLLISIGSIIAVVGLLGSISVTLENEYALSLYAFLLFCVFGLYVTVTTWGFIRLDYLKGIVSDAMRELFNKAMQEKYTPAQYAVNEIQKQLECCGNVGPSEYAGDLPPSCSSYVIGCNQAFYDFFRINLLLLTITSLVFGFMKIIQISLTAYFANECRIARSIISRRRNAIEKKLLIPAN